MKKFIVDQENISDSLSQALDYIQSRLKDYHLASKQEVHALLMAEESLTLLIKHADFSQADSFFVNVSKLFGNIRIKLTVPGDSFDFGATLAANSVIDDEGMPETQETIQNILIHSFEDSLKYEHKHRRSLITVTAVKSPMAKLYMTLTALFAAVILGILLKNFAPESFCMAVNNIFLIRFRTMYMNAMKIFVTPLVFLSIIICIAQFKNLSEMGKTGAYLFVSFLTMTLLSASIGAVVFFLFNPDGGAYFCTRSGGCRRYCF